ncbi:MAG: hypothetical protein ACE5GU_15510 [Candidatus Scalinduaceae bacterium]
MLPCGSKEWGRAEPFASCHSEKRSDEESHASGSELALSTTKG